MYRTKATAQKWRNKMIIIFLYFYILLFYTEVCERTVLTEATYICQKSFFFLQDNDKIILNKHSIHM